MKVLVTGGAGFIGSNLVRQLLLDGHDVAVLDDFSSGYRANLEDLSGLETFVGDVRDKSLVDRAVAGREVVFHLAASVGNKRSIDDPVTDAEVNVLGTLHVLEAARRGGSRKVVLSSSAGIFGELKTIPIREDHPVEPDTPYGSSKLCAEKLCLSYAKLYGMENVCLRYFNVYGPRQRYDAYGNVIPIFVFQALRGEQLTVFGDGEQTRDFLHVRDVVQANTRAALASGVWGAFNIGSGTRITINDLIRMLRADAALDFEYTHGPARPGDVRHSLADISAAAAAFGFKPSESLGEGLREYVDWARHEAGSREQRQ